MECKGFARDPVDFRFATIETPQQLQLFAKIRICTNHSPSGRLLDKTILYYLILEYIFRNITQIVRTLVQNVKFWTKTTFARACFGPDQRRPPLAMGLCWKGVAGVRAGTTFSGPQTSSKFVWFLRKFYTKYQLEGLYGLRSIAQHELDTILIPLGSEL